MGLVIIPARRHSAVPSFLLQRKQRWTRWPFLRPGSLLAGDRNFYCCTGRFYQATNQFARAGAPADKVVQNIHASGSYHWVAQQARQGLAALEPADTGEVATAIVSVIDALFGRRSYRVYVDPSQDCAEAVFRVGQRMRREMHQIIGLQIFRYPKARLQLEGPTSSFECRRFWAPNRRHSHV